MRTHRLIAPSILLIGSICVLASAQGEPNAPDDRTLVAQANNRFAVDLYQKLRTGQGNLFFSPYSLFMALGMAYTGARGTTQEQMTQALHVPVSASVFAQVCGGLMKDLNTGGKEGKYELNVANALWGQKDYSFSPVYIKLVETEYEGKLQNLDFAQSGEACQTINAWMEKQTKDKIKDLIPSGSLDSSTRLVLTNAIYFKGVWSEPFHEGLTHPGDFKLLDGTVRQVPTMRSAGPVAYFHYETDDLQILCLPYVGDRLDMVVLLPKQTDGITQLEQQLTSENLAKWVASAKKEKVFVFLPKFKATSTLSLAATLASLGMENTFSSLADFSGMTVKPDTLFISDVVHKACVDVDEKGTEAAAATGGGLMGGGGQPFPTFIADHPFIYLIRDRKSGCILFLGRMMDPAS